MIAAFEREILRILRTFSETQEKVLREVAAAAAERRNH